MWESEGRARCGYIPVLDDHPSIIGACSITAWGREARCCNGPQAADLDQGSGEEV